MPKVCGELKELKGPRQEGGRSIFPIVRVGNAEYSKLIAANSTLADELASNVSVGEEVCLFVYGHLSHRKGLIGFVKPGTGRLIAMPGKALFAGLFWYVVISPVLVGIAGALVGGVVGMIGGQRGTALGVLLGIMYGVGISWFTAYRFYTAYQEMRAG